MKLFVVSNKVLRVIDVDPEKFALCCSLLRSILTAKLKRDTATRLGALCTMKNSVSIVTDFNVKCCVEQIVSS